MRGTKNSISLFVHGGLVRNNKKLKLGKLNFYIVDDNYINYLSQFDKHIAYNKKGKRPYIGGIIMVEKYYYFAPLFSPKQKHMDIGDWFLNNIQILICQKISKRL